MLSCLTKESGTLRNLCINSSKRSITSMCCCNGISVVFDPLNCFAVCPIAIFKAWLGSDFARRPRRSGLSSCSFISFRILPRWPVDRTDRLHQGTNVFYIPLNVCFHREVLIPISACSTRSQFANIPIRLICDCRHVVPLDLEKQGKNLAGAAAQSHRYSDQQFHVHEPADGPAFVIQVMERGPLFVAIVLQETQSMESTNDCPLGVEGHASRTF